MGITFPGESAEYRVARNELLEREVELRRVLEDVAIARRALPLGGDVPEDYVFQELRDGAVIDVRLSELFAPGRNALAIYNFMFPRDPGDDRPPGTGSAPRSSSPSNPALRALGFSINWTARRATQRVKFAVAAKTPIATRHAFAQERGWRHLLPLSASDNSFKGDYGGESTEGEQRQLMSVFERRGGENRHFWTSEML